MCGGIFVSSDRNFARRRFFCGLAECRSLASLKAVVSLPRTLCLATISAFLAAGPVDAAVSVRISLKPLTMRMPFPILPRREWPGHRMGRDDFLSCVREASPARGRPRCESSRAEQSCQPSSPRRVFSPPASVAISASPLTWVFSRVQRGDQHSDLSAPWGGKGVPTHARCLRQMAFPPSGRCPSAPHPR